MSGPLPAIAGLFGRLSLLAVGGGNGILPAMQHASVTVHRWLTNRQFLDMFAISRAAPGPGSLIVLLIGQKAAGLPGAAVAGAAMYGPTSLAAHLAARLWRRAEGRAWRETAERALAPLAVGLTFAGGIAVGQSTLHGARAYALTAVAMLVLAVTEMNPLIVLAGTAVAAIAMGL
ncbi:MAG: chromate transporter [Rhodospirillales bacterium]|nr:chromate transporter [Rhodospirillales bacterium]